MNPSYETKYKLTFDEEEYNPQFKFGLDNI